MLTFRAYANDAFFSRGHAPLSQDEAFRLAAQQRRLELTQTVYTRCHGPMARTSRPSAPRAIGSTRSQIKGRRQRSQPLQLILEREYLESFQKAGALPAEYTSGPPIRPGADPQTLLLKAAQSEHPEMLYAIAGAAANPAQMTPERDWTDQYAWQLRACQHGYPYSGNFDWVTIGRPNCNEDTASPESTIMAAAGNNWPAVQQRAAEIGAALQAGHWGRLGSARLRAAGEAGVPKSWVDLPAGRWLIYSLDG